MAIFEHHAKRQEPQPYVHQAYPSVRYHRSGATQTVRNEDEHDELMAEGDWSDTPAAFDAPAAEPEAPAADAPAAPAAPAAEPKTSSKRKR